MWFVLYCSLLLKNNESFSRTTPTIPVQVSPIFVFPESKYTTLLPPVIGSHSDYSLSLSLSSSSRWYARSKQGPFRIINLFPVPVAAPPQSIYVNRVRMKNSVPFVDRGRLLREKAIPAEYMTDFVRLPPIFRARSDALPGSAFIIAHRIAQFPWRARCCWLQEFLWVGLGSEPFMCTFEFWKRTYRTPTYTVVGELTAFQNT